MFSFENMQKVQKRINERAGSPQKMKLKELIAVNEQATAELVRLRQDLNAFLAEWAKNTTVLFTDNELNIMYISPVLDNHRWLCVRGNGELAKRLLYKDGSLLNQGTVETNAIEIGLLRTLWNAIPDVMDKYIKKIKEWKENNGKESE